MPEIGSVPVGQTPVGASPRPVGTILTEAFELYKRNAALLIVTAAVAMGPVFLVKDAILAMAVSPVATAGLDADSARMQALDKQLEEARARGASPAEIQAIATRQMQVALGAAQRGVGMLAGIGLMLLGMLITIPLLVLATYLAQAALTVVVADRTREGGSITWQRAWSVVGGQLFPLVLTSVLIALGVAVGLALCFLPGFAFAFLAAMAVPVVLFEQKSGVAAIRRSIELVRADWLRVLIVGVVFGVLQMAASWLGGLFIPSRFFFVHTLLGDLVSIAVLPIPIIGLVLLYQDILRSKMNVPETQLRSQLDALVGAHG